MIKLETNNVIDKIKKKFNKSGNLVEIPLLKGNKYFTAILVENGIEVSNLNSQPFLPWDVFIKTIELLDSKGGRAKKGNAMNYKLGEIGLEIDSIEGYIAYKVYDKKLGESVFRRITPISCILIWAEICKHKPGYLVLNDIV